MTSGVKTTHRVLFCHQLGFPTPDSTNDVNNPAKFAALLRQQNRTTLAEFKRQKVPLSYYEGSAKVVLKICQGSSFRAPKYYVFLPMRLFWSSKVLPEAIRKKAAEKAGVVTDCRKSLRYRPKQLQIFFVSFPLLAGYLCIVFVIFLHYFLILLNSFLSIPFFFKKTLNTEPRK